MRYPLFLSALLAWTISLSQSPATPLGQQVTPVAPAFEAPAIVTSKFSSDYPNNPATWRKVGENYFGAEIIDKESQSRKIIVYDSFGNQLYTQSELRPKKYPKPVAAYLSKQYPDEEFVVWKQEDADKNFFYFTHHKKDTLRFDAEGHPVRPKLKAQEKPSAKE